MANNGSINNMLIPNVSKLPKHKNIGKNLKGEKVDNSEFQSLLQEHVAPASKQNEKPISLSVHAAKRLKERNMEMDNEEFFKLRSAFNKLQEKGGQDSLVITDKAAYIVDVANQKVVTAIDKENIAENVFTKIDSTVLV
ncbi:MAG: TIGR02530 family flagellar biosynthesis protein [Bdellovibrionota bacterium]|nr:TIGR02530 family flagellar biosynthesis protein [Bdellovibrionota bacterium]